MRTIAVVTGSRADFGLLRPVMRAIALHRDLRLDVIVTGAHLLPPRTADEVAVEFTIACEIEMQRPSMRSRFADAIALGRGIEAIGARLEAHPPDVVLVLGDRIEALAAAAASAIAGIRVAHVHGGDRGEGVADESMRHAISKLAHLHFPATETSGRRLERLGEEPRRIHVVGSPAIDDLAAMAPLDDASYEALGAPEIVFVLHPLGRADDVERASAERLLHACAERARTAALHPNHDPGRDGIVAAIEARPDVAHCEHLGRSAFVGLLRRAKVSVGNSSAGLIEAAAIPRWCVNVGPRQGGREMPPSVIDCPDETDLAAVRRAIESALTSPVPHFAHPYGDGSAGAWIAEILATFEPDKCTVAKRNTY